MVTFCLAYRALIACRKEAWRKRRWVGSDLWKWPLSHSPKSAAICVLTDQPWYCLEGNRGETAQRQSRANISLEAFLNAAMPSQYSSSSSRSSDGNSSHPDEGCSASQVPQATVELAVYHPWCWSERLPKQPWEKVPHSGIPSKSETETWKCQSIR